MLDDSLVAYWVWIRFYIVICWFLGHNLMLILSPKLWPMDIRTKHFTRKFWSSLTLIPMMMAIKSVLNDLLSPLLLDTQAFWSVRLSRDTSTRRPKLTKMIALSWKGPYTHTSYWGGQCDNYFVHKSSNLRSCIRTLERLLHEVRVNCEPISMRYTHIFRRLIFRLTHDQGIEDGQTEESDILCYDSLNFNSLRSEKKKPPSYVRVIFPN